MAVLGVIVFKKWSQRRKIKKALGSTELRNVFDCPVKWEDMNSTSDDRVRHCAECKCNVFDFTELSVEEMKKVVRDNGGEICAQAYIRSDGTVVDGRCSHVPVLTRGRVIYTGPVDEDAQREAAEDAAKKRAYWKSTLKKSDTDE